MSVDLLFWNNLLSVSDLTAQRSVRSTASLAPVFKDGAVKLDDITHGKAIADVAIKDVDGLGGQVIVVRLSGADPEAVGTLGKDETLDSGDILVLERRQEAVSVDLGNSGR